MKKSLITLLGIGLFVGLFPWVFSYQGTVSGHLISIRAIGDEVGIALIIFGVVFLLNKKVRLKSVEFGRALEDLPRNQQIRLMLTIVSIYAIGVIGHKLRAHYMIDTHAYDLGVFSNICWNTANGRWFFSSEFQRNFMGVHVNWILWPLAFIYRIFPGAYVLLMAQALIMTATVPVAWILAERVTGSYVGGFIAAMLLVCSPYFGHTISNDFHPDVWLLPCLMTALLAWQAGERSWVLCFSMMAILAKEDVSVVVCGFGVLLLLLKGWRWTGWGLIAIGLGTFGFHIKFFVPHFVGSSQGSLLYGRYMYLGKNFQDMAANLFIEPERYLLALTNTPSKYWRFLCYFFPFGGLAFLSPLFIIPPVISILPHFLSQASTQLDLADIYALPSQPFIFTGAALGAKKLLDRYGTIVKAPMIGALLIVAGYGAYRSPKFFKNQSVERIKTFEKLKRIVPQDASLAAQQNLYPHFEIRSLIQIFPIGNAAPGLRVRTLMNPTYIIADRTGNALPFDHERLESALKTVETDERYQKVFDQENFLVYKRISEEPPLWKSNLLPTN